MKKKEKVKQEQEVNEQVKQEDDDVVVTRGEFREVLTQVFDNINEISGYLMGDVNSLFQRFAYPNHIKIAAMITLLEEKDVITREDVVEKAKVLMKEAEAEASEVDEEGNPIFNSREEH